MTTELGFDKEQEIHTRTEIIGLTFGIKIIRLIFIFHFSDLPPYFKIKIEKNIG